MAQRTNYQEIQEQMKKVQEKCDVYEAEYKKLESSVANAEFINQNVG